jgi:CBS domain-containing protein
LTELLKNLHPHPPFSLVDNKAFEFLEKHTQIAYYPDDTILIDQGGVCDRVYIVIKGAVESFRDEEMVNIYHENDIFGGEEILKEQPSKDRYFVMQELICYELPREPFLQLCEKYPSFKEYFFSSIIQKIELIKQKQEFASMSDIMLARVERNILHKPCIVKHDMPIKEALKIMEDWGVNSLLVKNIKGFGIVTDADLRYFILNEERKNLKVISDIQSYPILNLREGTYLFSALLFMTKNSIKHMPILDDEDTILGVLELIDIMSFFSNQSYLLSTQIDKASSIEEVIDASSRLDIMISSLYTKGVKSRYIAKLVNEINTKMYNKLFTLIFPESWQNKMALLLLGSEARAEQILRTDQDNAIIFEDGFQPKDVGEYCDIFYDTLEKIGYPRCVGNIMVTNPKWRQSFSGYKRLIDEWIDNPIQRNLIDMATLFDSYVIAGKEDLHTSLMDYMFKSTANNANTIRHFAKPIESFESALGIFSQFVTATGEHKNEIDIKKTALFLIVHGARSLALENNIKVKNTYDRIKELNNLGFLSHDDSRDILQALIAINTLRLGAQLKKKENNERIDNYVSVENMGKMDKDMLKDALKTAEKFKQIVSYHFKLSSLG